MFGKDLNTILGAFNKVQNKLDNFISHELAQADVKGHAAAGLIVEVKEHNEQAVRASTIQKNISKLLNG